MLCIPGQLLMMHCAADKSCFAEILVTYNDDLFAHITRTTAIDVLIVKGIPICWRQLMHTCDSQIGTTKMFGRYAESIYSGIANSTVFNEELYIHKL